MTLLDLRDGCLYICLVVALLWPIVLRLDRRYTRRRALRVFISEIFRFNRKDDCWDPLGSFDRVGLFVIVEVVVRDQVRPESSEDVDKVFSQTRYRLVRRR